MTTTHEYPVGSIGYYAAHPELRHPDTATSGSAMTPELFNYNYGNREPRFAATWTRGVLAHIIKALDGCPVTIVTDKRTGNTQVNVRLTGIRARPHEVGNVLYEATLPSGEVQKSSAWIPEIGTIIATPSYGAMHPGLFDVTKLLQDGQRLAGEAGRAKMLADGEGGDYGKSHTTPLSLTEWQYAYTPQNGPADSTPGKSYWTTVVVNP